MKRILSGLALAALITTQASAAELITTAKDATSGSPQAGAVAAPVSIPPLGAAPPIQLGLDDDQPMAAAEPTCNGLNPDGKPHGAVWAGVGTHGYRDGGGAVTAPLGKCGSVSIAVDRSEGGFSGWRR
jgi:hypothetical protein